MNSSTLGHFNYDLFNPGLFNHEYVFENSGVEKFRVEISRGFSTI
jgi:hypothetical protein